MICCYQNKHLTNQTKQITLTSAVRDPKVVIHFLQQTEINQSACWERRRTGLNLRTTDRQYCCFAAVNFATFMLCIFRVAALFLTRGASFLKFIHVRTAPLTTDADCRWWNYISWIPLQKNVSLPFSRRGSSIRSLEKLRRFEYSREKGINN
jgi:hypothetical protein